MITPIKTPLTTTCRKFDETFKREAVANRLSSGKSATVIGEELGISPGRLYAWSKPLGPLLTLAR
jgi:transposase-like protein